MEREMSLQAADNAPRLFRFPASTRQDALLVWICTGALMAWAVLAGLFVLAVPGEVGVMLEKSGSFTTYATRNASYFLVGFTILSMIRFLKASEGMDSVSYIKTTYNANSARFLAAPFMLAAGIGLFALFMLIYSTIKVRIPEVLPFSWDAGFARADKILFFGNDPWRLFAWLYDFPAIITALDFIYDFWAVLLVGSWVNCFISRHQSLQRRVQYCLAVILTWCIGGNLLAIVFSSAGPCYYDFIHIGSGYYAEQMAHLTAIGDLRALDSQDMLWTAYNSAGLGLGGISAMPSMHCATAMLFILMYGSDKFSRVIMIAFFITIFFGSIILAWHYALDGIFAAIIAWGCWKVAGKISGHAVGDFA